MPEPDQPPVSPSSTGDSSPRGGDSPPPPPPGNGGTNSGEILQPGATIARRFTLNRLIGRGGMGVVWEARDTSLGREVAIKFLGYEVATDPEAVADLRRETRRSLELTHPNIVRIYDYVEDPQLRLVGISMELLTGMSVQMLKLEQPQRAFTPEKVLPWLRQICAAIDYAHQVVGVIHRDIKPGNLFVNERGSLKIVDFGIAMVVRDSTSRLVQEARLSRSGTLAYMSHQQLKGDKPTPADDMYAIGALLYELFTSKPPFFRGDAHALMHQIMSQPPMPIAERQQELDVTGITVPASWEAAIMACLSKDAAARPASGQALLDMITGQTVQSSGDATVLASAFPGKKLDLDKTMVMGRAAAMSSADATMLASNVAGKVPPTVPNPANPPPPGGPAAPPPPPEKKKRWWSILGETGLTVLFRTALTLLLTAILAWFAGAFSSSADGLVIEVKPRVPDAQIAIDGRLPVSLPEKGPLIIPDLPDGQHSVSVEAKGFARFRDYVTLKKGKGQIDVKLAPAFGSLELIARPGSRYTLTPRPPDKPSGGEVGSSGKILLEKLRVGDFQLRVEHPDCLVADLGEVPIAEDEITYRRAVQKTLPASVYVTSEPNGASILIDGNSRGMTPFEIVDLPTETNLAIEARLNGYEPARANLNLKPGQRQDVFLDLKQVRGTLVVAARPGTHVIARRAGQPNIELGTIGSSGEETFAGILPQGRYSIALEHPDLQPETPSDVDIDPAKTNRITAKQVLWGSSLDVRSEPEGATVLINGALRGTTPTVIGGLPSGTPLAVEFRLRGKNPVNRTVTLRPRETGSLFVDRFAAEQLSVKIDVQPWDALRGRAINFVVDGARVSPRTSSASIFEVPIENDGLHTVQVEADGYQPRSIRFDSGSGNTRPYRMELEPLPAARVASGPTGNSSGQNRGDSPGQGNGFGIQPSNIVPPDADNTGGIKLVGSPSAQKVVDSIKSVAERRGWTVEKVDGDVVMLTLKKRGYDATVYCRYSAGGVEFLSDSYKAGRLPILRGKTAKTVPSGWIDNLKEDLSELLNER